MGQKFGSSLGRWWFWCHSHLEAWLGLEDLLPRWLSYGCWPKASVSPHVGLSTGLLEYPCDMSAGFPHSQWSKGMREEWHCLLCSHFIVTSAMLFVRRDSLSPGRKRGEFSSILEGRSIRVCWHILKPSQLMFGNWKSKLDAELTQRLVTAKTEVVGRIWELGGLPLLTALRRRVPWLQWWAQENYKNIYQGRQGKNVSRLEWSMVSNTDKSRNIRTKKCLVELKQDVTTW